MLTEEHKKKIKYLSQYKYADDRIKRKLEEIQEWKDRKDNISAVLSSTTGGTRRTDKLENNVINTVNAIDKARASIYKDIEKLKKLKAEIECIIECIQEEEIKLIMTDRYIHFKTWEEIAYRNKYNIRWVYRLHERALDTIIIENNNKPLKATI